MEVTPLTLHAAVEGLKNKEFSSKELTEELLQEIDRRNSTLSCYLSVDREGALAHAEEADRARAAGKDELLLGVPLAIKDNITTRGVVTTCASNILKDYIPPYDATVVEKLTTHGAFAIGKTNMDEFAMGSSTENSAFGATKNPHDTSRVPGGSSGGSAAAVAAGLALAALGSDTGGSIRQPASFCGVVGLKPTYGLVSRYGLVAMASSLDQIGPITKDVRDAAILLSAIVGHDPMDATSASRRTHNYEHALKHSVKGAKIGVPKEYFSRSARSGVARGEGIDDDVRKQVEEAIKKYEELGARVVEVSLPHTASALAVYYIIMPAEVSANLARFDGIRYGLSVAKGNGHAPGLWEIYERSRGEGFGAEVRRRIMLGTFVLAHGYYEAYYAKAQKVRTKIIEDFKKAFEQVDVLATPTSPTPAFKFGEKTKDPLTMYLSDIYTVSANLAGIPAISLPCGTVEREGKQLPVGLQLMGPHFSESTLLSAAYQYEQAVRSS